MAIYMKILKTERLILRNWKLSDAEDLYNCANDPEVGIPAGWEPHKNIEESKNIIQSIFLKNPEAYAVCLKCNNKVIGSISLKKDSNINIKYKEDECEIGYWIGKKFWGQGLIPEAIKKILNHAFENLNMNKIYAICNDGNEKSKRVLEKCGFSYQYIESNVYIKTLNEERKCHVYCKTNILM